MGTWSNPVRVVAGELGGRRLRAPRGRDTRPTPDRVREALFSLLGQVDGARVLDLYAGSGALAIEALSRGAARAVLVERAPSALQALAENVASLGLAARALVLRMGVERAERVLAVEGPFDLVLVDPPYADVPSGRLARVLGPLLRLGAILAPGAVVVVEHAARDACPSLPPLRWQRSRTYGDTALGIYEAPPAPVAPTEVARPPDGPTKV